jgi:leader peptidase (prepilin peptidase)/N-methyltransferase
MIIALLALAAWQSGHGYGPLWRALAAAAVLYAAFLGLALAAPPGSLGWGDVKLVGALGLLLGYLGWLTVWFGMAVSFGLAATYIVVRGLLHVGRGQTIPLGPALIVGTLVAVIVS